MKKQRKVGVIPVSAIFTEDNKSNELKEGKDEEVERESL